MEATELSRYTEERLQRWSAVEDLDDMMNHEIFPENQVEIDDQEEEENEIDDIIILHMDIREPLSVLRKLAARKIGVELQNYTFWLQDAQELEPHKNLVDQCVKGEGLVQINVQVQTINQRINIVDVLKPTDDALAALAAEEEEEEESSSRKSTDDDQEIEAVVSSKSYKPIKTEDTSNKDSESDKDVELKQSVQVKLENMKADGSAILKPDLEKPCLNWMLDSQFKKEQIRHQIPDDPEEWTVPQVQYWFQWAVQQFKMGNFNPNDWYIPGKTMCALTHEEFHKIMPTDPGNVFWTHLQLLKECKFVSVVHTELDNRPSTYNSFGNSVAAVMAKEPKIMRKTMAGGVVKNSDGASLLNPSYGVGSGNNGQVQLWQFLLDILTDPQHIDIIQWVGVDGEFKLINPERVAHLWGERKNKPAMNYEKLSRALRYYYDGDMISKVSGKRFAYKFDCDLKLLIGYDAGELSQLVRSCHMNDSIYLDVLQQTDIEAAESTETSDDE